MTSEISKATDNEQTNRWTLRKVPTSWVGS